MTLRAVCTWGEGPDVLLVNEKSMYMLYDDPILKDRATHGYSCQGSVCLNVKEAEALAHQLLEAVNQVIYLEDSYEQYCRDHGWVGNEKK